MEECKRPDPPEIQDLSRLITIRAAILHARPPRPEPRRELPEVMADLRRADLTVLHEGAVRDRVAADGSLGLLHCEASHARDA